MRNDIIESVEGPTLWCSPVVVTPKKGGEIRLCIDMRRANTAVIRERFPLPTIEEVLFELNGSIKFSQIDIRDAFHQIELDENSRAINTFATHKGLYRYKRLLFGVSCAPEMYHRVLSQILAGLKGCCHFMDDIVIHGKTQLEHDENLKMVGTSGSAKKRVDIKERKMSIWVIGDSLPWT